MGESAHKHEWLPADYVSDRLLPLKETHWFWPLAESGDMRCADCGALKRELYDDDGELIEIMTHRVIP
jgi:hypothetical protein